LLASEIKATFSF